MRTAEERAVKALGQEKIEQFIALHDELMEQICGELFYFLLSECFHRPLLCRAHFLHGISS